MRFRAEPLSAAAHASSAGTPAAGNAVTSEKDFPTNDPIARAYDVSKRDHFFSDAERRKPLPYLK